jgi:3'(2'), 5'-bisphosphate nucleotidase
MQPEINAASPALWERARRDACAAALAAWRAIEPLYHGEYAIEHKIDGPATEADHLADRLIGEALKQDYPADAYGYLTEESMDSHDRLDRERVWIVDPIDGTRDFIRRNGNFAIQIGLVERCGDGIYRPVVGVVYRPVSGGMYSAVVGQGTLLQRVRDGELEPDGAAVRCRVSNRSELGRMRAVVSNSHRTSQLMRLIEGLGLEDYRHMGSVGVKACTIADGEAEVYVMTGFGKVNEWDVCAPELILREAGGGATDLLGRPFHYNRSDAHLHAGLLASNGAIHETLVERVRRFMHEDGARLSS